MDGRRVYVDIETLPGELSPEELTQLTRKKVPRNIKREDTIARWMTDNRDSVHRKTALSALHGRILCIAVGTDDTDEIESFYGVDNCLYEFCTWLHGYQGTIAEYRIEWVGWNVRFDLQFLRLHAARLDLERIGLALPRRSSEILDLQAIATAYQRGQYMSLADAAGFFGWAKGEGLDGSMIYDTYRQGEHDLIRRYCEQDVRLTRELAWKLWA